MTDDEMLTYDNSGVHSLTFYSQVKFKKNKDSTRDQPSLHSMTQSTVTHAALTGRYADY